MQNDYWLNEYYRGNVPFYFNCPYCKQNNQEYYRFDEEESQNNYYGEGQGIYDSMVRYPIYQGKSFRNKIDIEIVAKSIYKEISKDVKYVESLPLTKELMNYVIKSIVVYLDKHHDKFMGPIENKIQGLMKGLRKDLYWIFEILALFGVTPEVAVNFVEDVIDKFLREIMPVSNAEQNSPMWGA